ncbi:hypothetical protein PRIPAC_75139 [Pristionchus pacificus]|uniref:Uncharacterized protein n=1 Tax=Pristionchus pacificus TaxID=54126 RepID=A0A2A6C5Y1_PRIPA|nr:hypothetical protein PRIPAC_75139 [Pristionchus pacificus]|eukprot:PDM73498.1 hypothetical protein PRIPAC_40854 [Pristionchus pacificus]
MEASNASSLDEDPPSSIRSTTTSEFRWPSPWWLSFVVVCLIGILFNCSTFWKSVTTRKRGSPTTRVSLSLLCVMAGADTACLLALLFTLSLRYLGIENANILSFACRFNLFVIHSASAFSLYCWLILSLVRYVAVFSPYKHLRLNREPILATLSIGAVICLLEFYVFYEVTFDEQYRACHSRRDHEIERRIEVLLFRATWSRENSLLRKSQEEGRRKSCLEGASPDRLSIASDDAEPSSTGNCNGLARYSIVKSDQLFAKPKRSLRRFRQFRALRRALAISIFDLLLNLPNYLFRLYISIAKESPFSQETTEMVENISQLMYFGQFSLNAFYLVCLIYDSPRRKKGIPVSSNQHSYAQTYTTSILSTQPSMKWQRSLQRHGVHRKSTPANAGLLMEP